GVQQTARAQSASSDNTNNFGNNPFYLMSRSGSGDFCAGLIDDVRIYSRALSAGEIQQIYSLGTVLNKQAMQIKAISSGARYSPVLAPGIITGQYIQDGLFSFSVTGDTGRGYGVEASPDALHWTVWPRSSSPYSPTTNSTESGPCHNLASVRPYPILGASNVLPAGVVNGLGNLPKSLPKLGTFRAPT